MPLQRSREACRKREKDERGKGSKNIRSVQKTRKGLERKGVRQFRTTQPRARQNSHTYAGHLQSDKEQPHLKRIRLVFSWISESKFGSKELKPSRSP